MMQNTAAKFDMHAQIPVHNQPAQEPRVDASSLSKTIYKTVVKAMDGPKGINPSDLIAALGALAGYSARWLTIRQVANGKMKDDFMVPKGCNMPFFSISQNANAMISDLTRDSFVGVLTKSMMAAGASWLPTIKDGVNHNFIDVNNPTFPDYSVDEHYWPETPPQASLLMLWEAQARLLAHSNGAEDVAVQAYAMAVSQAAKESEQDLPLESAAQIALESAIAMAKLKYAF